MAILNRRDLTQSRSDLRGRLNRFEPLLSRNHRGKLKFTLRQQVKERVENDCDRKEASGRDNKTEKTLLRAHGLNFFFETAYSGYLLFGITGASINLAAYWISTLKSLNKYGPENFRIEDFHWGAGLGVVAGALVGAFIAGVIHKISRRKFVESLEENFETERVARVFE